MAKKKRQAEEAAPRPVVQEGEPAVGATVAPEIYVDGFQGVMVNNGIIKLNLYSDHLDTNEGGVRRTIAAHLTMPIPVMFKVHEAIGRILKQIEQADQAQKQTTTAQELQE